MLFLKVDVLELDEARERARLEGAFKQSSVKASLLAVLDCVVRRDFDAAYAAYVAGKAQYQGDTPFAEYLHPVVYEVLKDHVERKCRMAQAERAVAEGIPVSMLAALRGAPADPMLRLTYPRLVPYTGQVDLATLA